MDLDVPFNLMCFPIFFDEFLSKMILGAFLDEYYSRINDPKSIFRCDFVIYPEYIIKYCVFDISFDIILLIFD